MSRSIERSVRALLGVLVALAVAVVTCPAAAIERQHHLGLSPALGILQVNGKSTASVGIGAGLHYAYGLSDQWNFTLEASSVVVAADQKQDLPSSPRDRPATVDHGGVGVAYVIDVLRWVPYVSVQGGAYRLAGGTLEDALIVPGLALGVGLDYEITRHLAVGLGARQHFLMSKLSTYPSYTTALFRFEIMWGY